MITLFAGEFYETGHVKQVYLDLMMCRGFYGGNFELGRKRFDIE